MGVIATERLPLPCVAFVVLTACGGSEPNEALVPADAGVSAAQERDAGTRDGGLSPRDGGVELDLHDRLLAIEGLAVDEIAAPLEGTRAFALRLRQPEDHQNPEGVTFEQRMILVHKDERAPTILATTGYGLFSAPEAFAEFLFEPTAALDGNQLTVEHRFFGESIADAPTWRHLNIEQSANDSHRIVALLSEVYEGPWVGTGVSKGGMTAIFHHRFFPEDLAAIVPYVAPISFGREDPRYLDFVARIGPEDGVCRERVMDMAVELIERRVELASFFAATDPTASPIRPEVLEAVVTYPAYSFHWGFWQGQGSVAACEALPPRGAPIAALAEWFPFRVEYIFGFGGYDPQVAPYGYQVDNELGAQSIDNRHLYAVASEVDYSVLPNVPQEPPPWGAPPRFDPEPIREVDTHLREVARHVLGVYGAWDPWSGGIITVDEANDSRVVVVPEIGHGAQIAMLPRDQQDEVLALLNEWIGRRTLVRPDWRSARERMAAHRADHEAIVRLTLEAH